MDGDYEYKNSKSQYGKIFAPLEVPATGTVKYVIGIRSINSKMGYEDDYSDYIIETWTYDSE